jgi:tRNA1(Val) A37 N6-methylase TrmN6
VAWRTVFVQGSGVFKLGSDSVLLSAFVNLSRIRTVFDIGCGSGILPVLLSREHQNSG